ncbi:MAG TPA: acetaldehyde dehydrogenase (acetylating) [Negativicutes bacterium]|jgi:acetaldehyde dehydrogenase
MKKRKVVIIGSGNIGMDLMYKVRKSSYLEMSLLIGLDADSPRLLKAKELGIAVSDQGIQALIDSPDAGDIVFDATTAYAHKEHAPILRKLGKLAIDLTPASVGAKVLPAYNLEENLDKDNINMVSCGGQALIPIIRAVSDVVDVEYAELLITNSSKSVGPGTRVNMDEFINNTRRAAMELGRAKRVKVIGGINPADPPIKMHNSLYMLLKDLDTDMEKRVEQAINDIIQKIKAYVPGYKVITTPQFDNKKKMVMLQTEVEGAGDYLPSYAGNLDIINQAAIAVAERFAKKMGEGA